MAQTRMKDKPESAPMSLPRVYLVALDRLAERDGHANRSAIVRKLVDREARECLGEMWLESARENVADMSAA